MPAQGTYELLVNNFLSSLGEDNLELRNCGQTLYTYKGGAWGVMSLEDGAEFDRRLHACAVGENFPISEKYNQVWRTVKLRALELKPEWLDARVLLALPNGTLDPQTGTLTTHDPDDYTTRRINVEFDADATCPEWLTMLDRCVEDKEPAVRDEYIDFLQMFFGMGLFGFKPGTSRDLRKALIMYGESKTGKTSVADVLREFYYDGEHAGENIDQISKEYGLAKIMSARAVIADDAVKKKSKVDPAVLKKLITGEPMTANVKYKDARDFRFRGPVVMTTNIRPKIDDETDALFNRCVVLEFQRKFDKREDLEMLAPHHSVVPFLKAHGEFPGILNWAIAGGLRALNLGHYGEMRSTDEGARVWRSENDVVYDFVSRFAVPDKKAFCSVPLLARMISVYAEDEHRAGRDEYSPKKVANRLMSEVKASVRGAKVIRVDRNDVSGNIITGMRLNEEGIAWEAKAKERGAIPAGMKWQINGKGL